MWNTRMSMRIRERDLARTPQAHSIQWMEMSESAVERNVPLRGASNFRDMGGYQTRDGGALRWGRLYRSGSLARLTDEDLTDLERLELKVICDLRRDEERADAPSRLPKRDAPEVVHLNIGPRRAKGEIYRRLSSREMSSDRLRKAMRSLYALFVTDYRVAYGELMRRLVDEELPLLFHCAAGKDRTGFGAALVLAALDVPREAIFEDYLLTNQLLRWDSISPRSELLKRSPELFHVLLSAHEDYLQASFDAIDELFGGVEGYLAEGLELDAADVSRLRSNLLE